MAPWHRVCVVMYDLNAVLVSRIHYERVMQEGTSRRHSKNILSFEGNTVYRGHTHTYAHRQKCQRRTVLQYLPQSAIKKVVMEWGSSGAGGGGEFAYRGSIHSYWSFLVRLPCSILENNVHEFLSIKRVMKLYPLLLSTCTGWQRNSILLGWKVKQIMSGKSNDAYFSTAHISIHKFCAVNVILHR
jgi:hypothetical protein